MGDGHVVLVNFAKRSAGRADEGASRGNPGSFGVGSDEECEACHDKRALKAFRKI